MIDSCVLADQKERPLEEANRSQILPMHGTIPAKEYCYHVETRCRSNQEPVEDDQY